MESAVNELRIWLVVVYRVSFIFRTLCCVWKQPAVGVSAGTCDLSLVLCKYETRYLEIALGHHGFRVV